ncbi:class I alpha-mannosidase 1A [Fonsecaea pedrosoi]|nr:class I alpha-mannosidase 1A [Fonsecaea pedrosoi]
MMRLRRYRLFVLVAVVAIVSVYQLTRVSDWKNPSLEALVGLRNDHATKQIGSSTDFSETLSDPASAPELLEQPQGQPAHPALPPVDSPGIAPAPPPLQVTTTSLSSSSTAAQPTVTKDELFTQQPPFDDEGDEEAGDRGQSRHRVNPQPVEQGRAYWIQQEEHFPIPAESLIPLPTDSDSKVLPKVQYSFGRENPSIKTDRLQKQAVIREAFEHAWFGYKNYSLPHDELKPISKDVGDPFNGWGATLVDSLDALWIMGLRDEFHDAVAAVSQIDFKTSARKDIPLFETTIRYLGGLIAAYDLSSGKYPVLLDKAVELADILMGAFDTPNRMPAVFYHWTPSSTSRPHRGSEHTVLAEIGSLAVEFTRLAQITRETRYYDAIARVTNALEEWQMKTTFPGLWPLKLDASGCKKPQAVSKSAADEDEWLEDDASVGLKDSRAVVSTEEGPDTDSPREPGDSPSVMLTKRQQLSSPLSAKKSTMKDSKVNAAEHMPLPLVDADADEDNDDHEHCEAQGLSTEPDSTTHTYGIGSMADSTYEYFPKEYALLGGMNEQYKRLYLDAMKIVREELLFRPMTKENHDILFLAKQNISPKAKDPAKRKVTIYEGTHLGCFAGGMFGLGAKLFDIPSDMVIAEKLTNACVWAYASTPVGVMAEEFELVPCESLTSCKWNESRWYEALDPRLEERMRAVETYNVHQQKLYEQPLTGLNDVLDNEDEFVVSQMDLGSRLKKRNPQTDFEGEERTETISSVDAGTYAKQVHPLSFTPRVALSHEEYVAAKIQEERLAPGYTRIKARDYRLRPEAIESVFIMYRLTGDETWRDKGWAMFNAVDKATRTEIAHAGIRDVTSRLMEQQDSMESFWLAETLKYYYLLFSEPDLISLDDYVL